MRADDEFSEFDTDEATFDAMMAEAEPAELVHSRPSTTVTVEQADDSKFQLRVPAGFVTVSASSAQESRHAPRARHFTVHHRTQSQAASHRTQPSTETVAR
jgi:hypothetical protein